MMRQENKRMIGSWFRKEFCGEVTSPIVLLSKNLHENVGSFKCQLPGIGWTHTMDCSLDLQACRETDMHLSQTHEQSVANNSWNPDSVWHVLHTERFKRLVGDPFGTQWSNAIIEDLQQNSKQLHSRETVMGDLGPCPDNLNSCPTLHWRVSLSDPASSACHTFQDNKIQSDPPPRSDINLIQTVCPRARHLTLTTPVQGHATCIDDSATGVSEWVSVRHYCKRLWVATGEKALY